MQIHGAFLACHCVIPTCFSNCSWGSSTIVLKMSEDALIPAVTRFSPTPAIMQQIEELHLGEPPVSMGVHTVVQPHNFLLKSAWWERNWLLLICDFEIIQWMRFSYKVQKLGAYLWAWTCWIWSANVAFQVLVIFLHTFGHITLSAWTSWTDSMSGIA